MIAGLTIWLAFWPMKCGLSHESFFLFALWFGYLLFTCLYFYTSHNKFCLLAWKFNIVFFHCFCLKTKCILITPIHSLNTYFFLQKNKHLPKFLVYLVSITFILIKYILYKITSPLLKIHIFLFFSPRVFKKTKQLTIYCITLIFSTFCCNLYIYLSTCRDISPTHAFKMNLCVANYLRHLSYLIFTFEGKFGWI